MAIAAAEILKSARERAGLSQRDLAARAGTSQSVIARIELGETSPTWDTLLRLLRAAAFELRPELVPLPVAGSHMLDDVARIRSLSPVERLREVANVSRFSADAQRG